MCLGMLQEGAGWAIIVGFGFVFSLITSLIVYVDYTFGGTAMTSEEFNTAGDRLAPPVHHLV